MVEVPLKRSPRLAATDLYDVAKIVRPESKFVCLKRIERKRGVEHVVPDHTCPGANGLDIQETVENLGCRRLAMDIVSMQKYRRRIGAD